MTLEEEILLEGLQDELENFKSQEVVANVLGQGSELREFARDVEEKLRQVELDSIQDYIKESDNLASLHSQIEDCNSVLTHMETLLGGFQADLGAISAEIKSLQEKSMGMGVRLHNRKLSGKLRFAAREESGRAVVALKDVQPELERLRAKAVTKIREFLLNKIYNLRKPKTNVQILQQSVLLKYKYLAAFLREHGKEVYPEVSSAYMDTMSKVLSLQFRTYIQKLEMLQQEVATRDDLIGGVDNSKATAGFFGASARNLKNRSAVFSLGDRADLEAPAIIPHIAEASGRRYPYEVLFRSLHKLLMDHSTSEYFFCEEFFGDEVTFTSIFAGPMVVIEEHLNAVLPNCFDAIALMLMIRMTYQHQLTMSRRRIPCLDSYFDKVNLMLWPRFKVVLDAHLGSLKGAAARALWEDDVHPHYVTRRYAEFAASMLQLNTDYGDGQLEMNLERLRAAVDTLLVDLSRVFPKHKQRMIFLINNYDLVLQVLKETGSEGGRTQQHFEDLLSSLTSVYVEEELREHFRSLIDFVRTRAGGGEDPSGVGSKVVGSAPITAQEAAIELMHKDVITNFSNFVCGMDILRAALTQLLLYYTRLSDSLKKVTGGASLAKDVVSIPTILIEIKKFSRTF
eukprot:jgi/Mesen1/3230/ME000187S02398